MTIPQNPRTGKHVADLVIEHLALSEAELIERVVDFTIERDMYREMVQILLAQFARTTAQLDTARREIRRLRTALERTVGVLAAQPPRNGPEALTVQ